MQDDQGRRPYRLPGNMAASGVGGGCALACPLSYPLQLRVLQLVVLRTHKHTCMRAQHSQTHTCMHAYDAISLDPGLHSHAEHKHTPITSTRKSDHEIFLSSLNFCMMRSNTLLESFSKRLYKGGHQRQRWVALGTKMAETASRTHSLSSVFVERIDVITGGRWAGARNRENVLLVLGVC